jgi:aspartyl protease family protein
MRPLLLSAVLIALVGASLPSLIARYVPSPQAARSMPGANAVETRPPTSAAGRSSEVRIEAERDGHFYVDAEINDRPVRLMVDTGATVVALRQSDAETAGVRVRDADFTHAVSTANGTAYAAEADLDSVGVRDIEVGRVRALILPDDQLAISLLGGSFLNRLARFQVEDGTLVFEY